MAIDQENLVTELARILFGQRHFRNAPHPEEWAQLRAAPFYEQQARDVIEFVTTAESVRLIASLGLDDTEQWLRGLLRECPWDGTVSLGDAIASFLTPHVAYQIRLAVEASRVELLKRSSADDKGELGAEDERRQERERITGWLLRESEEYDKLERASGNLSTTSTAGTLAWAAQKIEEGIPE